MLIYFIVFFISFLFALLAKKFYSTNKKYFYFFTFLAILTPSILAGIRTQNIGTDTKGYVFVTFHYSSKFNNIVNWLMNCDIEPLYAVINYMVSFFTKNINWCYFIIQIIIISFAYFACLKFEKAEKKFFPIYFLTFLLLYYNRSLNMVRQSIALAVYLFSFSYLKDKKFFKYFLLTLVAIGFHYSAIIMLPIYFFYHFVNKNKRNKIIIFILLIFLILFYDKIGVFLINNITMIPNRYLYYFQNSEIRTLLIPEFTLKLFTIIACIIFYKKLLKKDSNNEMLIYLMIFDIIIYLLSAKFNYAQRLSYYFGYLNIFLLPQFPNLLKIKYLNKKTLQVIFIICLTLYSFLFYGWRKYDQTVPYESVISSN